MGEIIAPQVIISAFAFLLPSPLPAFPPTHPHSMYSDKELAVGTSSCSATPGCVTVGSSPAFSGLQHPQQ